MLCPWLTPSVRISLSYDLAFPLNSAILCRQFYLAAVVVVTEAPEKFSLIAMIFPFYVIF